VFQLHCVQKKKWYICLVLITKYCSHYTHPFKGPLSRTTRVSRYQKGKTNLDFTEARDSEWHWHQLGHMQVCTSFQTDNHASTPPLSFLQAGCPSSRPTNSVKALKANTVLTSDSFSVLKSRLKTFLFWHYKTLLFLWLAHCLVPAPLKLWRCGAIQICLLLFGLLSCWKQACGIYVLLLIFISLFSFLCLQCFDPVG